VKVRQSIPKKGKAMQVINARQLKAPRQGKTTRHFKAPRQGKTNREDHARQAKAPRQGNVRHLGKASKARHISKATIQGT
jgi:hypothetical protein